MSHYFSATSRREICMELVRNKNPILRRSYDQNLPKFDSELYMRVHYTGDCIFLAITP